VLVPVDVGSSSQQSAPLRVVAVLDSELLVPWIGDLLRRIDESAFASILAVYAVPPSSSGRSGAAGLSGALLRLYLNLDRRLLAGRALAGAGAGGDGLRVLGDRFRSLSLEEARRAVVAGSTDVVLAFGPRPSSFTGCASHGVWSLEPGDLRRYAGDPPGFWEVRDGVQVIGAVLRQDADGEGVGRALERSYSALDAVSLERNRRDGAARLAQAVLLRLRQLHEQGPESLRARADREEPIGDDLVGGEPSLRDVVRFLLRVGGAAVDRVVVWRLLEARWFLAYRRQTGELPETHPAGLRVLERLPGRFSADPCLVEHDGRHLLFFEDYVDELGHAVVSCLELAPDPEAGPEVVLRREHHLSYPFVFEWEGRMYMLPESAEARRVELFRAEEFPRGWVSDRTLLDGVVAVDPTLLRHAGRFWLFVGMPAREGLAADDELHLYSASSLEGEWIPHPWNPVVCDVRHARPAGRIFESDGALVRPSQDCSRRYGFATVLNRIDVLSETEYRETPMSRIEPGWLPGNQGTHTYARDGTFEVVDGYVRVSRFRLRRRV
jgi:hypothetical protein